MGRGARIAAAWCGIAGPAGFTAAWVASSLRQPGYSAGQIQISGLAARLLTPRPDLRPDRHPR